MKFFDYSLSFIHYPLLKMAIIGIVAVANNFAVGKNGKLPWHYAADLKFFKETTLNSAIVMGFNTWLSIGKPLPKRLNVVLSRSNSLENQPNVLLLRSVAEVLALSNYLKGDTFIIGGAKTYAEFSGAIEKWIVTEIPETVEDADAFMPKDFLDEFERAEIKELEGGLRVKIFVKNQNR
ncbi:MAG: dihydrofolate reductase [Pyrinomonadaceae bacterium]|nr:dihydrofolate reductase [Pyrinomonadaceae bacterium]